MVPTSLYLLVALLYAASAMPPTLDRFSRQADVVTDDEDTDVEVTASELQPSSTDEADDVPATEVSDEQIAEYFNRVDLNNVTAPETGVPEGDLAPKLAKRTFSGRVLEEGPYFEGDILLPPRKNGVRSPAQRWPGGVVPYVFKDTFSPQDLAIFKQAFNDYKKYTCIRFVRSTNQPNYVSISRSEKGCFSVVGNQNAGAQSLNIQVNGCNSKGTIIHELMHAIGFYHEQSRADRDNYIQIFLQNVKPDQQKNFQKASDTSPLGIKYDYGSIMQYSETAFGHPKGAITMRAKRPLKGAVMGQNKGFSRSDVRKINRMYKCKNYLQ